MVGRRSGRALGALALCALVIGGVGARAETPEESAPAPAAPVVLVLGDSLSAGYGVPLAQGWVSLLQQRIRDAGLPQRVVNASISGETTAGGLTRLPKLLREYAPAVVIIELGANDGLRGFAPARIERALVQLAEAAQAAGSRVLLVGVRLPPNYGAAYAERFQRVFPDVAERVGAALVPRLLDGVAEDRAQMQPDGLHPLASAQPRLLDNVWGALLPLLRETAAPGAGPSSAP
jgi:acyl-CoA thioesterase-1